MHWLDFHFHVSIKFDANMSSAFEQKSLRAAGLRLAVLLLIQRPRRALRDVVAAAAGPAS